MDLIIVTESMITNAVRKHSALFECPEAHDECIQEIVSAMVEDLTIDGDFYVSFFNITADWAEEGDHIAFSRQLGDVYREFLEEDMVAAMVENYADVQEGRISLNSAG